MTRMLTEREMNQHIRDIEEAFDGFITAFEDDDLKSMKECLDALHTKVVDAADDMEFLMCEEQY